LRAAVEIRIDSGCALGLGDERYRTCVDLAWRNRDVSFNSLFQCKNITINAVSGPKMHNAAPKIS